MHPQGPKGSVTCLDQLGIRVQLRLETLPNSTFSLLSPNTAFILFLLGKGNVWKGYNNERFEWVNRNFSINFWNNETRGYVLKYFLCQIWDK